MKQFLIFEENKMALLKQVRLYLALGLFLPQMALAENVADKVHAKLKALCEEVVQAEKLKHEVKHFSLQEVMNILKKEGYQVFDLKNQRFQIKVDGRNLSMYMFDGGDLQLYYGMSGVKIDDADINQWNRTRRLSRAYLDKERDPVLEADLDATQGLTYQQVFNFVEVFIDSSVPAFRSFLMQKEQIE